MQQRFWLSLALVASLMAAPAAQANAQLGSFEKQVNQGLTELLTRQTQLQQKPLEASWKALGQQRYQLVLPDHIQRETYMNVFLQLGGTRPVLQGQVLTAAERDLLVAQVRRHFGEPTLQLEVFPFQSSQPAFAISKQTGSDLYVKPQAVAGDNLATQVRLGTPLQILAFSADKKFARVRVHDDGYIAWIQRSALQEVSQADYTRWLTERRVIVMNNLTQPAHLPFGTRLALVSEAGDSVSVRLPDGKSLQLKRQDVLINSPGKLPTSAELLKTARQYLPQGPQGGGTYLWGGTFGKRLDCSGFVQTVFRVNGVYLPRDADQQKRFSQPVANTLSQAAELQPGDLVFFSSHGKWPTHVGLYLGQDQFIHASAKGQYDGIKINSLRGGSAYDQYLQKIYFGGGRVTRSL
jgi:hypothetical protein